jgi:hypothetical protein
VRYLVNVLNEVRDWQSTSNSRLACGSLQAAVHALAA